MSDFAHADFWVVMGTAAPVLLVANLLSFAQTIPLLRIANRLQPGEALKRRIINFAYVATIVTMVCSLTLLIWAAFSLADQADIMGTGWAVIVLVVDVIVTCVQAGAAALIS